MLQGFGGNPRSLMANKRRNRSVSESAGGTEASSTSRVRRLSGGASTVTLPTSNAGSASSALQKPCTSSVNLAQYRNRTGSFGSGRLGYTKRRNDSASASSSQRDLSKQQPRSRHNSGSFAKTQEVPKTAHSSGGGATGSVAPATRDRLPASAKPELTCKPASATSAKIESTTISSAASLPQK